MKKIALCMIVKNESAIITRCLASVRPLVDYVFAEDTGSTDGTQDIIRAWLAEHGIAGEVYDQPWQDFGANRTHVLTRLREKTDIDYALMMDADDILLCDASEDLAKLKAGLKADFYDVAIQRQATRFYRPHLLSNRVPFTYRGVVHEFLEVPPGQWSRQTLSGIAIDARTEGARSADPRKYERDAQVLQTVLNGEEDPFMQSRYTFYLAQSLRDAGQIGDAIDAYLRRANLGFWDEERYVALLQAARLMANANSYTDNLVEDTYCRAIALKPERLEAVASYGRYLRLHKQFQRAVALLTPYLGKPVPETGLFLEPKAYNFDVWDEYAVSAYWCGAYKDCLRACLHLLKQMDLLPQERQRVSENAAFALSKL